MRKADEPKPYNVTKYLKWDPANGKAPEINEVPEFKEFEEGTGPDYKVGPKELIEESLRNTEFFRAGLKALNVKLAADAKEQAERN